MPGDASLEGRVVVVTGASRGIGRAVARAAAAFGAHVALCDKEPGLDEVCASLSPGTESFAARNAVEIEANAMACNTISGTTNCA